MGETENKRFLILLCASLFAIFIWSAIRPHDLFTWSLEVFPAIIGIILLALTYNKFRFTMLVYLLVSVHSIILFIGGHYTYAEVPFFNYLRDTFALDRNYYDRVGHFAQGFIPAIIAREIILRTTPLRKGKMLFFMIVCICLAISAFYEFIEWWVAIGTGTAADSFLGTQGDVWDTQWDMFLAFCGAIAAQLFVGAWHDRQLTTVGAIKTD